MTELNFDATNVIVGRLATHVAKQALLGHKVNIFNCEHAIISGKPSVIREQVYHRMFSTGQPNKGPFLSRMPDRFVRRVIRGMVPHKQARGEAAFERIMCYIGVPASFKDKKLVKIGKEASELPKLRYQTIGTLCASLGGRQ